MRAALLLAATADAVSNQNFKTVIDLLNGLKADLVNEANEEQTNWAKLRFGARAILERVPMKWKSRH
jgi:hypothetical protein